jgi:HAD superfamily hydrolase (TIGR01509 family)
MVLRLVIFDMDGVLCGYDRGIRLAALARASGRPAEAIEAAIWGSGFEEAADSGRYRGGAQYLAAFNEHLGFPLPRDQWIAARRQGMTASRDVLDLVRAVRRGCAVALLSNNGPLLAESIAEVFPEVADLFGSNAFFSHAFGTKKPDPAIFTALLARLGVAADAALLIDDKAHNVAGARCAGLAAHRFVSREALEQALVEHGVLPR